MLRDDDEWLIDKYSFDGNIDTNQNVHNSFAPHASVTPSFSLPNMRRPPQQPLGPDQERLLRQSRLSGISWNPGHERGTPDPMAAYIAGAWHVLTVQEESENTAPRVTTDGLHVVKCRRCVVLFVEQIQVKTLFILAKFGFAKRVGTVIAAGTFA